VVAEKLGIDIASVRQGMAADSRIGTAYLSPGAGFGGENFSHDILTSQILLQIQELKVNYWHKFGILMSNKKKFYSVNYGIIIMVIYKVRRLRFGGFF
jgi:UDPglucose 6-dehydrogenase